MSVKRAWVFWCDEDGCQNKQISFDKLKSDAVKVAEKYGWAVFYWICFCPEHAKKAIEQVTPTR